MRDARRAADFLAERLGMLRPTLAIVLGSGLGAIAETLDEAKQIASDEVPGFPRATIAGHAGQIHVGRWGSRSVMVFQGRIHLYEGHPVEKVTLAVRAAAALGTRDLILTNAAGSCDPAIPPGCLMRADDLMNLFFRRIGGTVRSDRIGGGGILDPTLKRAIDEAARLEGIELRTGVLCGSIGPSYETASEIRLWRRIGASAACMSTVPEAFAAHAAGMRVAAISLITNLGTGIASGPLDHAEVMALGARAGSNLGRLLRRTAGIL